MSKRGPLVLDVDARSRRPQLHRASSNRPGTSSGPVPRGARITDMTVDSILRNSSEIPSGQPRIPPSARPRRLSNVGLPGMPRGQATAPGRTTKISEKLVFIPQTSGVEEVRNKFEKEATLEDQTPHRDWAERLGKTQRGEKLPRLTAYCTAQSIRMRQTAKFLKSRHDAKTKLYEDCLYVVYHLPLLSGTEGYRVRSRPMIMTPGSGKSFLDLELELSERRDIHEFEDGSPTNHRIMRENGVTPPTSSQADDSPTRGQEDTPPRRINLFAPETQSFAEMFVFSYGVVVFWNFTERQERDILADLTFAEVETERPLAQGVGGGTSISPMRPACSPLQPRSPVTLQLDGQTLLQKAKTKAGNSSLPDETRHKRVLMVKPLDESDVETEEFHFQYSTDAPKNRIYDDVFTLVPRSDHMIKLTISHAVAQSTKLCYFEERMNQTMAASEHIPKVMAKTGELKMTRTQVLKMMGRLHKDRMDVNISSSILDVPNFFWDSEPVLQPLYEAIREYLEIDPRVKAMNEKSRVFFDLAEMLSDSVTESKMSYITWIIIVLIVVSLAVSIVELSMRSSLIQKQKNRDRDNNDGDGVDPIPDPEPPNHGGGGRGGDDDGELGIGVDGGSVLGQVVSMIENGGANGGRELQATAHWERVLPRGYTTETLGKMSVEERIRWARGLSEQEKDEICGGDVICRTFAGI